MRDPAGTLTAREAEVLALLRDRLTNVEISERLVVSVRTVESHVSALLRKFAVDDRRALARVAATAPAAAVVRQVLPSPLTPFVGRVRELDALVDAVGVGRLVTATGPGGVGKTRLALAAAHRLSPGYRDGAVFVDLVRVVDPAMVVATVADAVGVPERAGADREQSLLAALADRDHLLVLDNCEHVVDGVRPCVERLLTACPRIRVLATSRIRLMLPYETVFPVPGLSVEDDAVTLFAARMVAGGSPPPTDAERGTIQDICRGLDGMALAIELAAARVPAIGLDGLAGARLPLLRVDYRADHRHRSLAATIDWSYALLDDEERSTLRAASLFASLFDAEALATVLGRPRTATLEILGRLVDWNLVAPRRGPVTRYRILETIRQYATALSDESDEGDRLRHAHLGWARGRLEAVLAAAGGRADAGGRATGTAEARAWCAEVDALLDDGRAALRWAGADPRRHPAATALADLIAAVAFRRGRPGEAQRRYEEAAGWAASPAQRLRYLRWASDAAACRNVGADAVDLLVRAATEAATPGLAAPGRTAPGPDAPEAAPDSPAPGSGAPGPGASGPDASGTDGPADPEGGDLAAENLALAAMYLNRCRGIMGRPIAEGEYADLLARARRVSRGGPRATAAIAMAEGWAPDASTRSLTHTAHALDLARATGDPLVESMVLDQLLVLGPGGSDVGAGLDAARVRLGVLAGLPVNAHTGFEIYDAAHMASHLFLAVGNLAEARRHADTVTGLPFFREEEHIGLARRVEVDVLAGQFHTVVEYGERIERSWSRAGRPVAGNLAVSAYSVAAAHGILGNSGARAHWTGITESLLGSYPHEFHHRVGWRPTLAGYVELHRGDPDAALDCLAVPPDDDARWQNSNVAMWRFWYAAFWAEASVLARRPDAADRLRRAAPLTRENPIAAAVVERSAALLHGDTEPLAGLARRLAGAGCPYQRDRTEHLAREAR